MSMPVKGGSPGNLGTYSLSHLPYACGECGRERRSRTSFEKVVQRRCMRMIKNRELTARSRDRKQAYTLELEVEETKLKEIKQELQKKHNPLQENTCSSSSSRQELFQVGQS
ncbi:hypothetical protein HAX54_021165 [Datura stramonium]|uniref:BZIP domain-containing protein n=1 Tax=Datura stramonium TaxID=4076 RepID=A0ABS8USF7_DATST|nr:hypothetical protein [Datura stramonium]